MMLWQQVNIICLHQGAQGGYIYFLACLKKMGVCGLLLTKILIVVPCVSSWRDLLQQSEGLPPSDQFENAKRVVRGPGPAGIVG